MCISVTITDLFINDYITFSVYMNPFRSTDKDMGITAVLPLRTIQKKFINLFFSSMIPMLIIFFFYYYLQEYWNAHIIRKF